MAELSTLKAVDGQDHFDEVRRRYIRRLGQYTGRNVLVYATHWTQERTVDDPEMLLINEADLQDLVETVHGMDASGLDLILHGSGGSVEAVESLVNYLRAQFNDIRVIIPQAAISAATMLACAADTIVMGCHSSLGSIDPQIPIQTTTGIRLVPAQTIIHQFYNAKNDTENRPGSVLAWAPLLSQYYPGLLYQCVNATDLAKELVSKWLASYMFVRDTDGKQRAETIAAYLSEHDNFKSHGRLDQKMAKELGLVVYDLEQDQEFQDLVLSVFHATTITFDGAGVMKIIENHLGKSYVKSQHVVS